MTHPLKALALAAGRDQYGETTWPNAAALHAFRRAAHPSAILALIERVEMLEKALGAIAAGCPMPENWGDPPRAVDAYHRMLATRTLNVPPWGGQ